MAKGLFIAAALCLLSYGSDAQLMRWLVRGVDGVRMMDLSTPSPTVGSLIPGFGVSGEEDVNAMTDAAGNLLFCSAVSLTGEVQVWDANLNLMPNGFGLIGHSSILQSAICPIPCHPDRYYIFHMLTGVGDLYYSIVDMSLNGGLGDVTQKNVLIGTGYTEGLAISHQLNNGCRWLITSRVTPTGYELVRLLISQTSVGAPVAMDMVNVTVLNNVNEIELSPDNTRIAMSTRTTSSSESDIVVWDFDLQPGAANNQQAYSVSDDPIIGIQFSPAGGYVYFVGNSNIDAMDFGRVQVPSGAVDIIDANMGRYLTMTELGGNGRIYVAMNYNYNTMAEVANPDSPTLAGVGYNHNAVFITPGGCRPPLPNAIEGEPPGTTTTPDFIEFTAYPVGSCDTYQFVDSTCLGTWWEWDLGDGTVTNDPAPVHSYAAGTYDITLRVVACGDTLSLTKPSYITASSVPVDAAFSGPASLCAGDSAVFINSSSGTTSFQWLFGDGSSSTDFEPTHVYTVPGSVTVTLIASSSCLSDTAILDIEVIQSADVSFDVIGSPCSGLLQFVNNSAPGSAWLWTFGDGTTSVFPNPTHLFPLGSFTVTLIGAPGSACADTASMGVLVSEAPIAAFSFTTGCDQSATFINQSAGAFALSWDFGDGAGDSTSTTTHVFSQAGAFDVTLTITDSLGCTGSITETVNISPVIVAAFDVQGDPCQPVYAFTNTSLNASTFAWTFGDGGTSSLMNPIHQFADTGSFIVQLIVDPGSSCSYTATASVQVLLSPTANFMAVSGCGAVINVSSQSENADLLSWSFGDGTVGYGQNASHTYAEPGTYIVTLLASSANGCADTTLQAVDITPDPTASFDVLAEPCSLTRTFVNTSTWASSYLWHFGDGINSVAESPEHLFEVGTYDVLLVADPSEPCADSAWTQVLIDPIPTAQFIDSIGCMLDLHLVDQSQDASSVIWDFGDGSGGTESTHVYSAAGLYQVRQYASNGAGCTDTSAIMISMHEPVLASFTAYMDTCLQSLQLFNRSSGASSYSWSFGDGAISTAANPQHQYAHSGFFTITLLASDDSDCRDTSAVLVDARFTGLPAGWYIPNTFTPNGDGINDSFRVVGLPGCLESDLRIFNRWGALIHEASTAEGWDGLVSGQQAPEGVYVYVILMHGVETRGHVTLLR